MQPASTSTARLTSVGRKQKGKVLMTCTLAGAIILAGVLFAMESELEARPPRPQMCGGGCTCDQIAKLKRDNPGAYHGCVDKTIKDGKQYYFGCGAGGMGCCHMNGIVETCELLRPVPPPAQAPLQGTPIPPPTGR